MTKGTHRAGMTVICVLLPAVILSIPPFNSASAGTIASSDGWEWQNPLPQGNSLHSVWGSASNDIFVSGSGGTILHYNGTAMGNTKEAQRHLEKAEAMFRQMGMEYWMKKSQDISRHLKRRTA